MPHKCPIVAKEYKAKKYAENKEQWREKELKKKYGINLNDYNEMYAAQNGCCKICGKHQLDVNRPLCVDHNHNTGKVRGLLCNWCNSMLGYALDNKETLLNGIKYLEECDG
jgi:hypothetical protein